MNERAEDAHPATGEAKRTHKPSLPWRWRIIEFPTTESLCGDQDGLTHARTRARCMCAAVEKLFITSLFMSCITHISWNVILLKGKSLLEVCIKLVLPLVDHRGFILLLEMSTFVTSLLAHKWAGLGMSRISCHQSDICNIWIKTVRKWELERNSSLANIFESFFLNLSTNLLFTTRSAETKYFVQQS